jgi:hypothetical protein
MKNFAWLKLAALVAFLIAPPWIAGASAQAFNNESLGKTLTDMGLAPSPLKSGYLLSLKSGTFTVYTQVRLSADNNRIGFNANLGVVDETTVTADQWEKLMASNADTDPFYFYYAPDTKQLLLHFSMENVGVTPEIMHHYLDEFAQTVQDTAKLWEFTK